MGVALDFSSGYMQWQGKETVELNVVERCESDVPTTVSSALRIRPTEVERQPSGGAYTGTDVVWLLPKTLLGTTVPKPGDTIDDGDAVTWTVLRVRYLTSWQVFRCYCVDLKVALKLDHTISIQRPLRTKDLVGGYTTLWPDDVPPGGSTPYENISARVQLEDKRYVERRGIKGYEETYRVVVDRQLTLSGNDRVKWTDPTCSGLAVYLDIVSVIDAEKIGDLPTLVCRRTI